MEYTLITGASGGIGECLAMICASHGANLVLVARSGDKLEKIKSAIAEKYSVDVRIFAMDLTEESAPEKLFAQTEGEGLAISTLVNNAGFGDWGAFTECDWQKQADMVQLNIVAIMHLCRLYAPKMKERGRGNIMNLSSVAALSAGPYMSVYYASKSFVLSFSQALREELLPYGIKVTALCPGPTATGFERNAGIKNKRLFSSAGKKEKVARAGYKAMVKGKAIRMASKYSHMSLIGSRLFSRRICRKFVGKINKG